MVHYDIVTRTWDRVGALARSGNRATTLAVPRVPVRMYKGSSSAPQAPTIDPALLVQSLALAIERSLNG